MGLWVCVWYFDYVHSCWRTILTVGGTILWVENPTQYKMQMASKTLHTSISSSLLLDCGCNVTCCLKLLLLWFPHNDGLERELWHRRDPFFLKLLLPGNRFFIFILFIISTIRVYGHEEVKRQLCPVGSLLLLWHEFWNKTKLVLWACVCQMPSPHEGFWLLLLLD